MAAVPLSESPRREWKPLEKKNPEPAKVRINCITHLLYHFDPTTIRLISKTPYVAFYHNNMVVFNNIVVVSAYGVYHLFHCPIIYIFSS